MDELERKSMEGFPQGRTMLSGPVMCSVDSKAYPNGVIMVFGQDSRLRLYSAKNKQEMISRKPFRCTQVSIIDMKTPHSYNTTTLHHPYLATTDGLKIPLTPSKLGDFKYLLSQAQTAAKSSGEKEEQALAKQSKYFSGDSSIHSSSGLYHRKSSNNNNNNNNISGSKISGVVNRNSNNCTNDYESNKKRKNDNDSTGGGSNKKPFFPNKNVSDDVCDDDPIEEGGEDEEQSSHKRTIGNMKESFTTAAPLITPGKPTPLVMAPKNLGGDARKTLSFVQNTLKLAASSSSSSSSKASQRMNSLDRSSTSCETKEKGLSMNMKKNEPSDYVKAITHSGPSSSSTFKQTRTKIPLTTAIRAKQPLAKLFSSSEGKSRSNHIDSQESGHSGILGISYSSSSDNVRFAGIRNEGNTCYVSASIQALLHLPSFRELILCKFWQRLSSDNAAPMASPGNSGSSSAPRSLRSGSLGTNTVLYQFLRLAKEIDDSSLKSIQELKKAVDTKIDRFKGHDQHDAHEFLSDFLGFIHDDCSAKAKSLFESISGDDRNESKTLDDVTNNTNSMSSADEIKQSNKYNNEYYNNNYNRDNNDVDDPSLVIDIMKTDSEDSSINDNELYNTNRNDGAVRNFNTPEAPSTRAYAKIPASSQSTGSKKDTAIPLFLIPFLPTYTCFHSEVEVTLVCSHCGHRKEKKIETYRDFSVELSVNKDAIGGAPQCSDKNNINSNSNDVSDSTLNLNDVDNTLEALLKSFFCAEIRIVQCEQCNTENGTAKTENKILCLPKYLIIHLKRFAYNFSQSRYVKDKTRIAFPKKLSMRDDNICAFSTDYFVPNMTPYIAKNDDDYSDNLNDDTEILKAFLKESEKVDTRRFDEIRPSSSGRWACHKCTLANDPSLTHCAVCQIEKRGISIRDYTLVSVIRHLGSDLSSGHYICDVKNKNSNSNTGATDNKWSRCDDSTVSVISEERVLRETDTPYIMIYERMID